ncbi:hypothetical protein Bpfe_010508, partial [Biomphalaria pfeifferi]
WALTVHTCGLFINTNVVHEKDSNYHYYTCSWTLDGIESVLDVVLEFDREMLLTCKMSPAEDDTPCSPRSPKGGQFKLSQDSLTFSLKAELITKDNLIECVIVTQYNGTFSKKFDLPNIEAQKATTTTRPDVTTTKPANDGTVLDEGPIVGITAGSLVVFILFVACCLERLKKCCAMLRDIILCKCCTRCRRSREGPTNVVTPPQAK